MTSSSHPPASLAAKESALLAQIEEAGRLVIAFSGGVDSSYLAFAAQQVLGDDALAVTALSPSYPKVQRDMVEQIVADFSLAHRFVETHEMDNEDYRVNRADRCYHCKTALFERLEGVVGELGFSAIAYGINRDDTGDFRPGHKAAHEHRVLAPLLDADLGKDEIRALSRKAGLPTAEIPSSACLASRLPYGMRVTSERLGQVEQGEDILRGFGFRQVRLRHHGDLARIEVGEDELSSAFDPKKTGEIVAAIKALGFRWVALDLEGYRTGSLNLALENTVLDSGVLDNLPKSPETR